MPSLVADLHAQFAEPLRLEEAIKASLALIVIPPNTTAEKWILRA